LNQLWQASTIQHLAFSTLNSGPHSTRFGPAQLFTDKIAVKVRYCSQVKNETSAFVALELVTVCLA
jgi:hypothetical protein